MRGNQYRAGNFSSIRAYFSPNRARRARDPALPSPSAGATRLDGWLFVLAVVLSHEIQWTGIEMTGSNESAAAQTAALCHGLLAAVSVCLALLGWRRQACAGCLNGVINCLIHGALFCPGLPLPQQATLGNSHGHGVQPPVHCSQSRVLAHL